MTSVWEGWTGFLIGAGGGGILVAIVVYLLERETPRLRCSRKPGG